MLKGQSLWIPWISRGFIIIVVVAGAVTASVNAMNNVNVEINEGLKSYKTEAVAMNVLERSEKKAYLKNLDDDIQNVDDRGCDLESAPRFPERYRILITDTSGDCRLEFSHSIGNHYYLSDYSLSGNQESYWRIQQFKVLEVEE